MGPCVCRTMRYNTAHPQRGDRDALEDTLEESSDRDYGQSERAQEAEGGRTRESEKEAQARQEPVR